MKKERIISMSVRKFNKLEMEDITLVHMGKCKKILDVGCGGGRFISKARDRIEGLDACTSTVDYVKSKGMRCTEGWITKIPFEDNSFDGINCSHIIEHLTPQELYTAMHEMDRILKIGGILAIQAPLLHDKFYDTLSHVRPYTHKVFMNYMVGREGHTNLLWEPTPNKYSWCAYEERPGKPGYLLILKKEGKR